MKIVVAGSPSLPVTPDQFGVLANALTKKQPQLITGVYCADDTGIEAAVIAWAANNGAPVEFLPVCPEKREHQSQLWRNYPLLLAADALLAVWDGKSQGTRHMIETARKLGRYVRVVDALEYDHLINRNCPRRPVARIKKPPVLDKKP